MVDVIESYSPNTRWGKQHVEVTFKLWAYTTVRTVKVGGNCRGFDILEAALSILYDELCEADSQEPVKIVLMDAAGFRMECVDEKDEGDEWLKQMTVGVRIVAYDPPTLNQIREMNGAKPVPHGDIPHHPL